MDVTQHDLNLQIQQLISDYKRTGDERYKEDAEFLRSEFKEWWSESELKIIPPTQT